MPVPADVADLPVVDVLPPLGVALAGPGVAVVVAPPGAGKTTVVPLWLLEQPWLGRGKVVVLEPRRLAARAAARRMAALLGEDVGGTVGFQTRDERRIGPATRIEVVTEGVLTRRLQQDPELPGTGIVVFDEVHERNLPTDVGLAFALDTRSLLRPDLRIVAMSATPDAQRIARLLGAATADGQPAPIVESDGRMHPVEVRWAPPAPPPGGGRRGRTPSAADQAAAVADVVRRAVREEVGDVLVFLPGIGEIRRVEDLLRASLPGDVDVRPLAGALAFADQDLALQPSPPGRRRVVLSTDIAESSLTVDGVRIVVDAGLARVPRFDPRTGMTRLTTIATSRASADQRAGRAGRTHPGTCYRLWSRLEHGTRPAHLAAEITQVDLAGLALELAAWGTSPEALAFVDPPPAKALAQGRELLRSLGALDDDGRPTPRGRRMLGLPLHPRLARMVEDAAPGDRALACVVAAIVDERDVLRGRADELPADLGWRVRVVCGDERDQRADRRAVERVRDRALDVARRAGTTLRFDDVHPGAAGAVLALGYPDRVGIRRNDRGQFQLRGGGGAWVAPDDPLAAEAFVVAADLDGNRTGARIRLGAGLDADDVLTSLAEEIETTETLVWDRQRDDLVVRVEARLGSMAIRESTRTPPPGPEVVAALCERVRQTKLAALDLAGAAELRARVAFLRRLDEGGTSRPNRHDHPSHVDHPIDPDDLRWPDWSDRSLLASLGDWLAPFLVHATGAGDLARFDVAMALSSQLSWDDQIALAELAPPTLDTPSGRRTPIDYTRDVPTASVRVQDLFGLRVHPTLGGGRVPIALELLSPADRPIQITRDLPGFWHGTWADVRKEMAGRYPKHQWPVDPSVAPPNRLKRDLPDS